MPKLQMREGKTGPNYSLTMSAKIVKALGWEKGDDIDEIMEMGIITLVNRTINKRILREHQKKEQGKFDRSGEY